MRMRFLPFFVRLLLIAAAPAVFMLGMQHFNATTAFGQSSDSLYKLDYEPPEAKTVLENGRNVTKITARFTITRKRKQVQGDLSEYKIFIYETDSQGKKQLVAERDVPRVKVARDLSVILAVDISGSMAKGIGTANENPTAKGKKALVETRMDKAKEACNVFLQNLPAKADAGLILFDHLIAKTEPLSKNRGPLIADVDAAMPRGGTAYLDACIEAVKMLSSVKGRDKAIVVMTDGVDLNSSATLQDVIAQAKTKGVKVYPVGIGEAGKKTHVTSVLVLDKSGSMLLPANEREKNVSKLVALKRAAEHFIKIIPDNKLVRSSILEFSDTAVLPREFTNNKRELDAIIKKIRAKGETAFLDATYDAIEMLEAANPPDRKAIITLTDGIDNKSRRRVDEVINRAKAAGVKLYMLGFGKKGELDDQIMWKMAKATGGAFYKADNQKLLVQIFEQLSTEIHDDGIDVKALTHLADSTGGKYYHAENVKNLKMILQSVSKGIQSKKYEVTFNSINQGDTGLRYNVNVVLARRGSNSEFKAVEEITGGYQRRGLVIAQMSPIVYLGFLGIFAILIAVPMGLSRMRQSASAK